MNKLLILLLLVANCAFAQEKMKEAMPAGGLLNKKIKQTKWYFDAGLITDGKLDLSGNKNQPDVIHFVDATKFVISLGDNTSLSGTYKIFDLHDMGVHNASADYKTFRLNNAKAASPRAKKLASFLQQRLNVHYDLSEKTMDFVQDDISPIVPSISN